MNPYLSRPALLARVPDHLNQFADKDVIFYLWLGYLLAPFGHLKFYPAFNIIFDAALRGLLKNKKFVTDASSGNMAEAFAAIVKFFGVTRFIAYVPWDTPSMKREKLIHRGVANSDIILCDESPGKPTAIDLAYAKGQEEGGFNFRQYHNPKNPQGHELFTTPSILKQLRGDIHALVAAQGTNGTVIGMRDCCTKSDLSTAIVGGLCEEGGPVPGARSESRIVKDGFDYKKGIRSIKVKQRDAYAASLRFGNNGFPFGPAGGLAVEAANGFVRNAILSGKIRELRNKQGKTVVVVVVGDGQDVYREKYGTQLNPSDFADSLGVPNYQI